jgi:hypothetical protein
VRKQLIYLVGGGLWCATLLLGTSCKKEKIYTYGVDDVAVEQPGAVKPNVKSDLEVLSIAYTDLFGATIPADALEALALSYQSFGDKRLVMDMVILNFLNDPNVQIPTDATMRGNVEGFVDASYRKFFVREPSAFERWFVSDLIRKDAGLTPDLVYYAFMTSAEYRFY